MNQLYIPSKNAWFDYAFEESTMAQIAVAFQGRKVVDTEVFSAECYGVLLDDGTAVLAKSQWTGPYSRETPGVDADEPLYYLGNPA